MIDKIKQSAKRLMLKTGYALHRVDPDEYRSHPTEQPLPAGAAEYLRRDNPKLLEYAERYANSSSPATNPGLWSQSHLQDNLDMGYFRGDNAYVWAYRWRPAEARLRFFIYSQYIKSIDHKGLLDKLVEDGLFGTWTYEFENFPLISRDLLDSINEIYFLDRHLDILSRKNLRILDIGAGYGRLAHRLTTVAEGIDDYYCTDAIAESTFLCDYYLKFRGCDPKARVLPLDEISKTIEPGSLDLAINIHSFSECRLEAIEWWVSELRRLEVPYLLLIPNDLDRFQSTEPDGSKKPFLSVLEKAGYQLEVSEDYYQDRNVAESMYVADRIHLFKLAK